MEGRLRGQGSAAVCHGGGGVSAEPAHHHQNNGRLGNNAHGSRRVVAKVTLGKVVYNEETTE